MLASAIEFEQEDTMVTLLFVAAVVSYVLVVAYVLSWPPTIPH